MKQEEPSDNKEAWKLVFALIGGGLFWGGFWGFANWDFMLICGILAVVIIIGILFPGKKRHVPGSPKDRD